MDETQLIDECKRNNKRAQIELYRTYSQGMYNVAMRLLRNPENAEDIIQESFLSAFKSIHQFKENISFKAWLKRIVVNRCINFLKKRKTSTVSLDESAISSHETSHDDHWECDEGIVLEDVKKCIDQLPNKYRFVVMLYLIEGYDHSEISAILNISATASRSRLMRGKTKLKELLKHIGYGEKS